jgi:hypothetical protein
LDTWKVDQTADLKADQMEIAKVERKVGRKVVMMAELMVEM